MNAVITNVKLENTTDAMRLNIVYKSILNINNWLKC